MHQEFDLLTKNIEEIIPHNTLKVKLESGQALRVKLGADPTKPDLHLGHIVVLNKLKEFQQNGHNVIFLIGDFTAKIGDPSGRSKMRPVLSDREIKANVKTWLKQVGRVLDVKKCEIRHNSEWFSQMSFEDLLKIASQVSLSNVIERDDFKKRIKEGRHLAVSEILYPIMQGYDSVMLKADVEIGGQDQKLNMLMGRDLQGAYGQTRQDVITLPLLSGTDGKKMSKSSGNYIGLNDSASNAFGKLMSVSDQLIKEYLLLVSNFSKREVEDLQAKLKSGANPKNIKEQMAHRIVSIYWGEEEADKARSEFDRIFSKKETPERVGRVKFASREISLLDAMTRTGLAKSKSDAKRLIKQSAVRIDGKVVDDEFSTINLETDRVMQVGKRRFIKLGR